MGTDLMEVSKEVKLELQRSTIVTAKNYCFENALAAASFAIKEAVDMSKRPALEVCTKESINNAILKMATQGLNPAKNQCYFIVYGKKLTCVRSFMGAIMTAKLVNKNIADIRAQIVYQGDVVEIEVVNGRDLVTTHKRKFGSIDKNEIIGAYAVAVDSEDKILFSSIMTMDEIKSAWKKSKMNPVNEKGDIKANSTHAEYTAEMAKRTIYNKICKLIINTSDDETLVDAYNKTVDAEEDPIISEIKQNANQKVIDFEPKKAAIPAQAMATDDHCKRIYNIEFKANRADRTLETLGSFVGRVIAGLKELTEKEAEAYLDIAAQEMEASKEVEKPETATPSWG